MTETEQAILELLVELETRAKGAASETPKQSVLPLITRLDEFAAQLPAETDPELRHFLQRRSYEKARMHLEGKAAERGSCGH